MDFAWRPCGDFCRGRGIAFPSASVDANDRSGGTCVLRTESEQGQAVGASKGEFTSTCGYAQICGCCAACREDPAGSGYESRIAQGQSPANGIAPPGRHDF